MENWKNGRMEEWKENSWFRIANIRTTPCRNGDKDLNGSFA